MKVFLGKYKKGLLVTAIIMVALILTCIIYVNDYYHADDLAFETIENPTNEVTVIANEEKQIIFKPETPTTGLIFYPGGKVEYEAYAPLMEALAKKGVLCVLVQMPANLAVLDMNAADGIQEEFSDIEEWYIGGHSLGGSMAASYLGKHTDEYEGLVLLASYSTEGLQDTDLKVLSIYGSNDKVLNLEKYEKNKENLPKDFEEMIIEGGSHAYFGSYGEQKGDGNATISNEEQIQITVEKIIEFTE